MCGLLFTGWIYWKQHIFSSEKQAYVQCCPQLQKIPFIQIAISLHKQICWNHSCLICIFFIMASTKTPILAQQSWFGWFRKSKCRNVWHSCTLTYTSTDLELSYQKNKQTKKNNPRTTVALSIGGETGWHYSINTDYSWVGPHLNLNSAPSCVCYCLRKNCPQTDIPV